MEYLLQSNLLLESLACLGRHATGKSWEDSEQRILLRLADTDETFRNKFNKMKNLTDLLMRETRFCDGTDDKKNGIYTDDNNSIYSYDNLFHNIEGLPCNVIGLCSPAFLLFCPMLSEFSGNIQEFANRVSALPPSQIAENILNIISASPESLPEEEDKTAEVLPSDTLFSDGKNSPRKDPVSADQYMNAILSMNLPDLSKLKLLKLYNNYRDVARQAATYLAPLIEQLKQETPAIMALISHFSDGMRAIPQEDFFGTLSRLMTRSCSIDSIRFRFHPFLLGLDTVLVLHASDADDTLDIYCGFLREQLADAAGTPANLSERVFNSYRLLGDRTRYDILCYLKDHPAYGQELSFRFGLARNTIHHHMSKLLESGLISTTVRGNRIYYSLNAGIVDEFLEDQKKLLKPENGTTPPPFRNMAVLICRIFETYLLQCHEVTKSASKLPLYLSHCG